MTKKIEIPFSKNKLFFGIGGSILFVVLGIWLFLKADNSFQVINPIIVKGIGILSILFCGATGIFGIKRLFDKKHGLIIDSIGITDNSNASSFGLIEWNDITSITTKQVMSTKFLMIYVENPEKYIEKVKSGMKAKLMSSNLKMYGTPLSITSSTLKYDFGKLEQLIQTEFKRNKNVANK